MKKIIKSNDIITYHKNNSGLEYITFKALEKYNDKIVHGFFFRNGGVSEGVSSSLNFRIYGNDSFSNVLNNLNIVCNELNIKSKVYKALQAHTDNILDINDSNYFKYDFLNKNEEEYDSYVTSKKEITTVITTADCNNIIIYDKLNNVVANIHSGWKGTFKHIALKTAKYMNEKYNSKYADMIVCIGPSIGDCCFTTEDLNFVNNFKNNWNKVDDSKYIYNIDNKYHINLVYLIKYDLLSLGIKDIYFADICTCCNNDKCFSYRYNTMNHIKEYGTMGNFVGIL